MSGPDVILEALGVERRFVTHKPLIGEPTVVRAVDGVSLSVHRGETLAIVGESGCGKSTLARVLVRLLQPSDGSVRYEGRDISHLQGQDLRKLRAELQFIFQDPFSSLNPRMTVGALIEEPLKVHGLGDAAERRARVAELMRKVGLNPASIDRYPHEFSGGQRQRIGIARALASGPKLLVGDEPVSALDVSIQAQVVNILQDLKDELGLTLVIIAHDLAVIRQMADRVAVMYLGQVVELAPADQIFTRPLHPYTEALVAAIPLPDLDARKAEVRSEGDLPNPSAPPSGCRFHTRCPYAIDRCAVDRPDLGAELDGGRQVACHRAAELSLDGLTAEAPKRSAATIRRFELYNAARGVTPGANPP
ncbi:MAG: ABC transporter ATP-binding protein [Pseudodonghicola sp.]